MKNNEYARLLVDCVDVVSGLTKDEYAEASNGVPERMKHVIWELSRSNRWSELRKKFNAIADMPDEWSGDVIFTLEKSH